MIEIVWVCGVGIPAAALLFLFGYLKGLIDASAVSNWGIGFDDGWKAYKELVIETGRADNGFDKQESTDE